MVIILLYWLFLAGLFLPAGLLVKRVLKLTTQNPALIILLGMVLLTTGFSAVAFFTCLGRANLIAWSVLSLVLAAIFRIEISAIITRAIKSFRDLPLYLKTVAMLLFAGALLKSAQFPFVIDNESYYVQTIKWLNNYGFVKGLANLHIHFAQSSFWHVLQAGVNFSFITNRINDINGFLFIICTLYFATESYNAGKAGLHQNWLGFMPVVSVLLFQFIQAPSPDMPCLLLVPIIFNLFLKSNGPDSNSRMAFILFIFIAAIKLTVLPLGVIFLPLIRQKSATFFMLLTATPLLVLWILKNSIISGYPLYPFTAFKLNANWAVPENIVAFIVAATSNGGYYQGGVPAVNTFTAKMASWISMGGLDGILNKFTIAVLIIMPLLPGTIKDKKLRLIYLGMLLNFVVLLLSSPQFRYFLHITICASLFIAAWGYNYFKCRPVVYRVTMLLSAGAVFVLFFNTPLTAVTRNKYHRSTGRFAVHQLWLPEVNTRFPQLTFEKLAEGNLSYYSPSGNFFLYGTADGPLPCINTRQLHYFEQRFHVIPQQRSFMLQNGFYSASVK